MIYLEQLLFINLLHIYAFVYLWCGFVIRAEISSEEEKHEQVNPLLPGMTHHMEICQPLVVLDTRYHTRLAQWCICCGDLTKRESME